MLLKHFYFTLGLIFVSNLGFSQDSFDWYKESLKEMELMTSYFEEHENFSNSTYIEYFKENNQDQIDSIYVKKEVNTTHNAIESGYMVSFSGDLVGAFRVGLWTLKREDGSVLAYNFYSSGTTPVGPSWWFGENGSLIEKRYWHPVDLGLFGLEGEEINKEYYSQTFYENGNPKAQGDYSKGMKSGSWRYYSKNGELKKEKYY